MAQLVSEEIILRAIKGEVADPAECVLALVDRTDGRVGVPEGTYIDFKQQLSLQSERSVGEFGRDILAFSNTDGGLILFGVRDDGVVIGHPELQVRAQELRKRLAEYVGTRIDYETHDAYPVLSGRKVPLPFVLVRRAATAYPTLLRKHIELPGTFGRKVKYLRGSLFYREGSQTLVEPTGGDIDQMAVELGFTGASPRTRSSFVLQEDRPGVRLFAQINDRFFGRQNETAELIAKFGDVRGRGISIAGQGGIGKTELAIALVNKLYRSVHFQKIYSGSAKRTVLGPVGAQQLDPAFQDFPSFLRDLASWLGFDVLASSPLSELQTICLNELKASSKNTLLFVDNLETVGDGRLFEFLDNKIPANVWLLLTSRVHKIKNYIYPIVLGALDPRDAGRLLRHELKRQGLETLASLDINLLEGYATKLHRHPLAIRWYAWACSRDKSLWEKGPQEVPKEELESFCIGQTLGSLSPPSQKVVAAISTNEGQIPLTPGCISRISSVSGSQLELSLYELECAGLVSVSIDDETGKMTYRGVPLAAEPARDLARKRHWEGEFAQNLRSLIKDGIPLVADDMLIRDLLEFDPRSLRGKPKDELTAISEDLKRRIARANKRPHAFQIDLLYIDAECERHLGNIITADETYRKAADLILESGKAMENPKYQKILLEAATVAKIRGISDTQIRRAIGYLEAIQQAHSAPLRVLGSLVELYAIVKDGKRYSEYLKRVTNLRDQSGRFSPDQLHSLDEALARARSYIQADA